MASDLGLSCPRGGEWYICQGTKIEFVGCCTVDPCADGSGECAEANLLPASFSMNQYSKIPSLGCAPSTKPGYKQPLWWTCIAPVPPFMGCCHSNPCTDGCPEGNLSAARLPYEPSTREMFLTNANANVEPEKSSKLSSGAIAGIVVGAIAVIVALIGAYWFLRRKKQKKTAVENVPQTTDANGIQVSSYNKDSPNPNYSPHPSAVSPHSGYGYPNTPPQAHGFQNGYQNGYQTVPSELGSPYVAELSGNHQGEVAMLDSTPVGHHQTHSPTIPPSESTVTSGWPTDKK